MLAAMNGSFEASCDPDATTVAASSGSNCPSVTLDCYASMLLYSLSSSVTNMCENLLFPPNCG